MRGVALPTRSEFRGWARSSVLVWMILAAPLSEFHYLLVLLLPMMAMVFVPAHEPDGTIR